MISKILSSLFVMCACFSGCYGENELAFPEAEGPGAYSKGGKGGEIYHVTTLEDSKNPKEGMLRHAIETADGPRIIVFDVQGKINLVDRLKIERPYLTIDGSSAPGSGITLNYYSLEVSKTHDVIIRYLRCHFGDASGKPYDCLTVSESENVIIDHISACWSVDETLSVTGSSNVTVQWCIIGESLDDSVHPKGPHGYGCLISGNHGPISYHHNLLLNHASRNPRPGETLKNSFVDFRNNVVYNYGRRAGYCSDGKTTNFQLIGNYYKKGPSTNSKLKNYIFEGQKGLEIYMAGNVLEGAKIKKQSDLLDSDKGGKIINKPHGKLAIKTETAEEAYASVLAKAGASKKRDAVDLRLISQVKENKGKIINSQNEVGGY